MKTIPFNTLLDKKLIEIHGAKKGSEQITLVSSTGVRYRMYHERDCCEVVQVEDVIGEIDHLLNSPILLAEGVSSCNEPLEGLIPKDEYSYTYTFYKLATVKGYVTIRWLGSSNGYYGETVDFVELEEKDETKSS